MSQKDWSIYRADTGEFTGVIICLPEHALESHTPPGCKLTEGRFDPRRYRVDLGTGEIVEKEGLSPDEELAAFNDQYARAEITRLELTAQRALREALLTLLPAGAVKDRVKEIDDQIAQQLRPKIRKRD